MKKFIPVLFCFSLTACGGSGGDSQSEVPEQKKEDKVTPTTQPVSSKFTSIVGVYDATYNDNKAVSVIDNDGKYQVFDDLNDEAGGNKDCYAEPNENTPNNSFHGLSFEYDENSRHFKLKEATPSLAFEMDEDNKIAYIISGNMTVGGGKLSIKAGNTFIVISKEKLALSVDDVLSKKCS